MPIERGRADLGGHLDALLARYDGRFLPTDPLEIVHRYRDPRDQEIVAFLTAVLAYGRIDTIRAHATEALGLLGPSPHATVLGFDAARERVRFARFVHRFNDGDDLVVLLHFLRQMLEADGSIEGFFARGHDPAAIDVRAGLESFCRRSLELDATPVHGHARLPRGSSVRFLFPSPATGGASKRLNLFLRWVVRPADGVDLGLWTRVRPDQLVLPLDTHVARLARNLGLSRRRQVSWAMAAEATARLRELDPRDPIKYDFALCRMGILGECPARRVPRICAGCEIREVCRL